MEWILIVLILALLNSAIIWIDAFLMDIVPIALYAENHMGAVVKVDLFSTLYNVMFGFGISLIVLKFLKKGFDTYVLWADGDADEEPLSLLTNFFKALAVAVSFPILYGWLARIVWDMSDKILDAVGAATAYSWATWVTGIASAGLLTAIFGLIFIIIYFMLYFQFLMRGLEILILRVGLPLACVGLIDNDKGMFKPYMMKFFQSMLAVIVQLALCKLGIGLLLNAHVFWGTAAMMLALRTPKFLQDFIVSTGGGGSGVINNVYHSVRLVQIVKNIKT